MYNIRINYKLKRNGQCVAKLECRTSDRGFDRKIFEHEYWDGYGKELRVSREVSFYSNDMNILRKKVDEAIAQARLSVGQRRELYKEVSGLLYEDWVSI
jgi:hypothetical protein